MAGESKNEGNRDANIFWMGGTKFSCSVADVLAELSSRGTADARLMQFASEVKLRGNPRAQEYLANFLNGSGTTKTFELKQLLQEDIGVRSCIRRHFQNPVQRGVVTIGQQSFAVKDWKNALGTYFLYYDESVWDTHERCIKMWGRDTYQWHPDDTHRFTQCIHQAAERLESESNGRTPQAKKFLMIANPCTVDTQTGMPAPADAPAAVSPPPGPVPTPVKYMLRYHR